jgi:phosphatidylserine decarboxylase
MPLLFLASYQYIIIASAIIAVFFLILSLKTKNKLSIFFMAFFGVVFILILFFFRNPARHIEISDNYILSPCDGTVMSVEKTADRTRIHIFLSIFDVHRFRNPVSGTVTGIEYKKGKFNMAFDHNTKNENEYNEVTYKKHNGEIIKIRQIAGFIARRIFCDIKQGDWVFQGDLYGLISFGSGCLIDIPAIYDVKIDKKSKVRAGESLIAERKN